MAARVDSWVETYKKAMLTPVVLQLVADNQPTTVAEITQHITATTGWHITERGLYRTLKRLQDSELLSAKNIEAPRTGATRKEFTITPFGNEFLSKITAHLIDPPDSTLHTQDGTP